jgi:uncharacterized membrane protein YfcA
LPLEADAVPSVTRLLALAPLTGSLPAAVALALVVLFCFGIEAALGFGSTVLAVTLAAPFLPLELLLPTLVGLNLLVSSYITLRHRDGIDWRLLLTRILPLAALGMPVGMFLFALVGGPGLKLGFGAFVCALAARELYRQRLPESTPAPLGNATSAGLLLLGGLVHGLYASGGPMIVYVVSRLLDDKRRFRSTLSMLWLLLNAVLTVGYALRGLLGREILLGQAMLLPSLCLGIVGGEWLHHRVNERIFRRLVYGLLLCGGAVLVVGTLR